MNEMIKMKVESDTKTVCIRVTISTELLKTIKNLAVTEETTKEQNTERYLVKKLVYNELTSMQRAILFNKELVDTGTTIIKFDDIDIYGLTNLIHEVKSGIERILKINKILNHQFRVEVVKE